MSIELFLVCQCLKVRFDNQWHHRRRGICKILRDIHFFQLLQWVLAIRSVQCVLVPTSTILRVQHRNGARRSSVEAAGARLGRRRGRLRTVRLPKLKDIDQLSRRLYRMYQPHRNFYHCIESMVHHQALVSLRKILVPVLMIIHHKHSLCDDETHGCPILSHCSHFNRVESACRRLWKGHHLRSF